jgi:hypothetical protein
VPAEKPLRARLAQTLHEAPATVPASLALALFVGWAGDQAGYPVTHWAPGAILVLALLAIAAWSARPQLATLPPALRVALVCLALYTILSFLSILWAGVPADAWEGADRTLLYLLVFALFALWRQRPLSAAFLLCAWVLAMCALAAFVLLHLDTRATLSGFFKGGRLAYPGGYENASAATWAIAMWPALLLAAARELPWALRGVMAGAVVLLGEVALLSQSRGALFATPVMLVLVFALVPRRVRVFAVLAPVAAAFALTATPILRVGDRLQEGHDGLSALHTATVASFVAALAVGLIVAIAGALEGRRTLEARDARRLRRGVGAIGVGALVAVLAGGWIAVGDPVARIRHDWDTFTSGRGYAANGSGNRLVSGLGSQRYDFYRVAIDEFVDHPIAGVGADNFQQQYLARGHSEDTPHYPHSVEMRTLEQTGLVGALIALIGIACALATAVRAARAGVRRGQTEEGKARRGEAELGRAVAAAALAGFAYWAVHGSFDWFWEFAGLGAPAFALLGLACSLAPREGDMPRGHQAPSAPAGASSGADARAVTVASRGRRARSRRRRAVFMLATCVATVAAVASLAAPWLSQLEVENAARIWTTAPRSAYSELDRAASLNPLSAEPYLLAGSIALRFEDTARADHEFSLALGRTAGDAYATLERGAIASVRGQQRRAVRLLEHARSLAPRNPVIRSAAARARAGRRLDIAALNRAILEEARPLR